jgi:hypothetical protein
MIIEPHTELPDTARVILEGAVDYLELMVAVHPPQDADDKAIAANIDDGTPLFDTDAYPQEISLNNNHLGHLATKLGMRFTPATIDESEAARLYLGIASYLVEQRQ